MYLDYFGIDKPPFGITPDTSLFYDGAERGNVLEAMLYALQAGEGIIKVVGEVGSGKTMLSRMLTKRIPGNVTLVFLLNPSIKAEEVLYAIAYDLGLQIDSSESSIKVLHSLQEKLFELYQQGKKVVLVIDEAQQMPLDTLEEIRLLSNLETETEKLLQIILFGQPELDQHLNTPNIRQLQERIAYSFYLSPLTWQAADKYIQFRLAKAGHQGRAIFKTSAIKLLSRYSNGTLRRLNMLADKALLAAFLDKNPVVTPKHVRTALRDNVKGQSTRPIALVALVAILVSIISAAAVIYWLSLNNPPNTSPVKNIQSATIDPIQIIDKPRQVAREPDVKPIINPAIRTKQQFTGLLDQRLNAFEAWQQQHEAGYTIRLLSATSDDIKPLEQFLQRVKSVVDINQSYVTTLDMENNRYVVYYGNYPGYSEALDAMSALPASLKKSSPYITLIPK